MFRKGATLDPFLDRVGDIVARTQRRRAGLRRQPMADRNRANDGGHGPRKRPKIELVLYTSAASQKCQKAIRTVNAVLKNYNREEIDFSICDLATASAKADEDSIVFTPTLVKRGPGSRTWIVGNLDEPDLLIDLLDVNGVAKRKPNRFD